MNELSEIYACAAFETAVREWEARRGKRNMFHESNLPAAQGHQSSIETDAPSPLAGSTSSTSATPRVGQHSGRDKSSGLPTARSTHHPPRSSHHLPRSTQQDKGVHSTYQGVHISSRNANRGGHHSTPSRSSVQQQSAG